MSKTSVNDSTKIGALYIRVSTGKQEELSPDAQKRLLLEYAKDHDILVDPQHIYIENGISGKSADRRPQFQLMIANAKQKPRPFDVILLWKFSRFARNQDEAAFYKSVLRKKCGIDVVSITEPIADGMYGRLMEMIIEWNDEFYSYNLSQEVMRGMTEKALRGGYQTSPCLGYKAVGHGEPFVIDEDAYKIYEYICDQYDIYGKDTTKIARQLNDIGYHTRRGNSFDARAVSRILRNPFYIGIVNWNGQSFRGTHEVRADEDRYNARIKKMDAEYKPAGRRNVSGCKHWLSGLIKCPICGATMALSGSSKTAPPFFQCWRYVKGFHRGSVSITEKKLTRAILQNFDNILAGQDFQYQYIRSENVDESETELLQKELEKLAAREKRIKLAYENEIDTLEEYRENKTRLATERDRILSELENVKSCESSMPDKSEVLSRIREVYDVISNPDVDYEMKGKFMRSILKDIVYDKENQQLIFHFYVSEAA